MITTDGYSKDPGIRPEGIVITFAQSMIEQKGGMMRFMRQFLRWMEDEENQWMHWNARKPKYDDLLYVYIIINGKLRYRCYYGGYGTRVQPHLILAGPVERCPFDRPLTGFRGFRYCTKLF
jgi:hypothetical protein